MKRFFVIECDTDFHAVFVREVKQDYGAENLEYHCKPDAEILICNGPSPKFYGQLDALLINRTKLDNAQPIEPEKEATCQTK